MESSNIFKNNSLDFVYIDANHSYDECKKDIDIWWKKVRNGGVLSGHDYLNGVVAGTVFGVKDAVDKFVEEENLKLYITEEDYPTWYLLKK
jgi:predicted O-methyltransferase YrrM